MATPHISVVMSVYNTEAYLKESIDSILNQTYENFEFIIINDGSTDSSLEIIKSYSDERIVVLDQKNTGLAKALNNGVAMASGKYIARMDADDFAMTNRLDLQVSFLESNPDYVVVGSNAEFIDIKGEYLYTSKFPTTNEQMALTLPLSPFFHSSTMFQKKSFEECKGYNEEIKHYFEDRILWNKMARLGKLHNMGIALIKYRIVPTGISNRSKKTGTIFNEICNKIISTDKVDDKDVKILESISERLTLNQKLANYYLRLGKIYLEYNFNRKKAFKNLCSSLRYDLFNKITWFNLLLTVMPISLIIIWKKSRGLKI
ncbi:glycosyltransferase family 2 protein [Flavobacterium sp. XS2P39]|uniref:glycosyltransferase family 2 protein n=1 Tax=Flavobacterium sp. XS2P39 TaxID=3401725 RepID=UPI003AAFBBF7